MRLAFNMSVLLFLMNGCSGTTPTPTLAQAKGTCALKTVDEACGLIKDETLCNGEDGKIPPTILHGNGGICEWNNGTCKAGLTDDMKTKNSCDSLTLDLDNIKAEFADKIATLKPDDQDLFVQLVAQNLLNRAVTSYGNITSLVCGMSVVAPTDTADDTSTNFYLAENSVKKQACAAMTTAEACGSLTQGAILGYGNAQKTTLGSMIPVSYCSWTPTGK